MAEVYAGFLSHADDQLGRMLDYLEESGQLDNTLIVLVSDNGASGEGGPNGSVNENKIFNGVARHDRRGPEVRRRARQPADLQPLPDRLGLGLQHAVQDVEALRELPGRHGRPDDRLLAGADQADGHPHAVHARDRHRRRRSTSCLGIELPEVVNGVRRSTRSRARASLRACTTPKAKGKQTQFYSMLGTRGDLPRRLEGRVGDAGGADAWGDFANQRWELFNTEADPSECHDLAEQKPEKLQELVALWWAEAGKYGALPLESRDALGILARAAAAALEAARPLRLLPGLCRGARVGHAEHPQPLLRASPSRSTIDTPEASGVLFAQGARFGGHALYLKDGKLKYVYNWVGEFEQIVESDQACPDRRLRALGLVREGRRRDADRGHAQPLHQRREGRRGEDQDPARQVLARRRRAERRQGRRRAGHRRLSGRVRPGRSSAERSTRPSSTSPATRGSISRRRSSPRSRATEGRSRSGALEPQTQCSWAAGAIGRGRGS